MNSKRHIVKRFFAIILTVMMVVTLLPLTAFPAFDVFANQYEMINSLSVTIPTTGLKNRTFKELEAQITTDNKHVSVYGIGIAKKDDVYLIEDPFPMRIVSFHFPGEGKIGNISDYESWTLFLKADEGYCFPENVDSFPENYFSCNVNQKATGGCVGGGISIEEDGSISFDATSPYFYLQITLSLDDFATSDDAEEPLIELYVKDELNKTFTSITDELNTYLGKNTANGGCSDLPVKIKLLSDIELDGIGLNLGGSNAAKELDLNGYKLSSNVTPSYDTSKGATLSWDYNVGANKVTITGPGTIENTGTSGYAMVVTNKFNISNDVTVVGAKTAVRLNVSNMVLNGGTYVGEICHAWNIPNHTVEGGFFDGTFEYDTTVAKSMVLKGGYYKKNPVAVWKDAFPAEGYVLTQIAEGEDYYEDGYRYKVVQGNPEPAAAHGYSVKFQNNEFTLIGPSDAMPGSISVYNETEDKAITDKNIVSGLDVTYSNCIYRVDFVVFTKSYTMHVNCKTVDAVTTVDTEALDAKITQAGDYAALPYSEGNTSNIVTSAVEATQYPISDAGLLSAMTALSGEYLSGKNSLDDQMIVDQQVIALTSAVSAFEGSIDAQLVVLSGKDIVKGFNNQRVVYEGISYCSGIVLSKDCVESSFDALKDLGDGFYTVIVNAAIDGVPVCKTYYIAIGTEAETDTAAKVAAALAELTPVAPPSGDVDPVEPPVVPSVLAEGQELSAFADITAAGDGKISIVPKAGVKVERIAISTYEGDYKPLKNVDTSIDAIADGNNCIKVLLRTGNDTKAFTTSVNVECNTPAVAAYSGAVGVYSRGTSPAFIAYAKGEYDSLGDALTAEMAAQNPTTVYYVKDNAALDKVRFSGTYTFFFGEEDPIVVTF